MNNRNVVSGTTKDVDKGTCPTCVNHVRLFIWYITVTVILAIAERCLNIVANFFVVDITVLIKTGNATSKFILTTVNVLNRWCTSGVIF